MQKAFIIADLSCGTRYTGNNKPSFQTVYHLHNFLYSTYPVSVFASPVLAISQENMGWKRWSPGRSVTCAKEPLAKVQCLAETTDCVALVSPPSLSRSDKFIQVSSGNLHHFVQKFYYINVYLNCHFLHPTHAHKVSTTPMLAPEKGAVWSINNKDSEQANNQQGSKLMYCLSQPRLHLLNSIVYWMGIIKVTV